MAAGPGERQDHASIASRDKRQLVANVTALARIAKLYGLPVVLARVNVATGRNQPTIHQIVEVLGDVPVIDRVGIGGACAGAGYRSRLGASGAASPTSRYRP